MYSVCRLRPAALVAHHFKMNESSLRSIVKKEIHEGNAIAMPGGMKTLHFLRNTVLSYIGNAVFMQVQNCCKKYKPIDSNMI